MKIVTQMLKAVLYILNIYDYNKRILTRPKKCGDIFIQSKVNSLTEQLARRKRASQAPNLNKTKP